MRPRSVLPGSRPARSSSLQAPAQHRRRLLRLTAAEAIAMVRQPSLLRSSLLRMLPFVIAGILPAGCVVSSADGNRYVDREEKRFSVDGKPDVKLLTGDGSIEIRSWDRQEVQVVVEKRAFNKQTAAAIEVT